MEPGSLTMKALLFVVVVLSLWRLYRIHAGVQRVKWEFRSIRQFPASHENFHAKSVELPRRSMETVPSASDKK